MRTTLTIAEIAAKMHMPIVIANSEAASSGVMMIVSLVSWAASITPRLSRKPSPKPIRPDKHRLHQNDFDDVAGAGTEALAASRTR